jgi:hypothetical protein
MTNILNQATRLPRLTKTKFLSILAITGVVIAATFLRADSDGDQHQQNGLPGTWISLEFGGTSIVSFMSDGRSIFTGSINIATGNGPGGIDELAAPAPGEWIRTGNREFNSTAFSVLSSPPVGSAHLVKLTGTYTLNKTSDELTLTDAMVSVFFPDGTLQFGPFPGGGIVHYKRVIAGQ